MSSPEEKPRSVRPPPAANSSRPPARRWPARRCSAPLPPAVYAGRGQHDQGGPGRLRRPGHRRRRAGPEHQGPDQALGHGRLLRQPAAVQPPGPLEAVATSKWTCPRSGSSSAWTAIKKAIDSLGPGGVVLLATPPAFRPIHVEYAVAKGCHVFMEKSFAVDAPGIRRVLKAGEEATKKNLKIAGGLMMPPLQATGRSRSSKSTTASSARSSRCWAYREHDPVGFTPKSPGESELAHQIRNY